VLSNQAVFVEPQNVEELAQTISRLWNDERERSAVAARAQLYADSVGGTSRLFRDILAESAACLPAHRSRRLAEAL
jgi:hypothetical protein